MCNCMHSPVAAIAAACACGNHISGGVRSSVQVLHAMIANGEVARAQKCLQAFGMPENALQADATDKALQEELRRCGPLMVEHEAVMPLRCFGSGCACTCVARI